jgi:hypothetical protein
VDGGAHGRQLIIGAMLYRALAFVMDEERALLGLLRLVAAYINERFDNVVERVDIVVVHDKVAHVGGFFQEQNVLVVLDLRFTVHGTKLQKNGQKAWF